VIAFYGISALAVAAAVLAVTFRNVFHCALALGLLFLLSSALFVLLHADFLAVVQVLIYVGAIVVLFIFAIVLTEQITSARVRQTNEQKTVAVLLSLLFLVVIGVVFAQTPWPRGEGTVPEGSIYVIGRQLLSDYLEPFEVASVLLLAALVGAIVCGKEALKR
jgi:NADH:ubiquinone oxidoreductase subunit 6 (subunit J)